MIVIAVLISMLVYIVPIIYPQEAGEPAFPTDYGDPMQEDSDGCPTSLMAVSAQALILDLRLTRHTQYGVKVTLVQVC